MSKLLQNCKLLEWEIFTMFLKHVSNHYQWFFNLHNCPFKKTDIIIMILKYLINIWSWDHRCLTLSRLLVKPICSPVFVNSWSSYNWRCSSHLIWQSEGATVEIRMHTLIWNFDHKISLIIEVLEELILICCVGSFYHRKYLS